jgi:hypothetical protein
MKEKRTNKSIESSFFSTELDLTTTEAEILAYLQFMMTSSLNWDIKKWKPVWGEWVMDHSIKSRKEANTFFQMEDTEEELF